MSRTDATKLRQVITTSTKIDVDRFITTATALTDYVVSQDVNGILTAELLLEIETYLAAHFYALNDQQYSSKSTGGASGSFQTSQKGKGLEATDWGQQAIALDVTGTLAALEDAGEKGLYDIQWLGKTEQQKVPWDQRN